MHVVHAVAGEGATLPEPGELGLVSLGFLASVLFLPLAVGLGAEETGTFLAAGDVGGHEGADVHADAVVEIRVPADGLL